MTVRLKVLAYDHLFAYQENKSSHPFTYRPSDGNIDRIVLDGSDWSRVSNPAHTRE